MKRSLAACWILVVSVSLTAASPAAYDPLETAPTPVTSRVLEVRDAARGRNLPLRIYLPETDKPAPVVLFSHGLGGSRDNNPYLGNHWAKRGYVVVFVQHPGSDESVWRELPPAQRMAAMNHAASLENFLARNQDIPAVIDALTAWNTQTGHPLKNRLDLKHLGMSGHSFGAVTTQAIAGQSFARENRSFLEPRISAAIMMSPSPPASGEPAAAFATIRIPCLLMTGTRDDSPIGKVRAADRLRVFPHLHQAAAWQVVFDQATHMAFSERDLLGKAPKDPRYHRAILALTTAFWDTQLKGDPAAKAWLNGEGAKSVLTTKDLWQSNPQAR